MDTDENRRVHGGIAQLSESVHSLEDVLDLSVSINPFGPPRAVRQAIERASITSYPDPHCHAARTRLATWSRTDPARIVMGNGAAELLWTLARTLLGPHDSCLNWEPCFAEFPAAVSAVGARHVDVRWDPAETLDEALTSLRAALASYRPRVAYLCAPSSPFGRHVPAGLIAEVARLHGDTTFVVDQSFLSLSPFAAELFAPLPNNVVAVRSLTKELGIPGVRVGYAVATPELVARLQHQRPQWNVSAAALAAAECYPDVVAELQRVTGELLRSKREFVDSLTSLGLRCYPSDTPYFVVELPPELRLTASRLNERLLRLHRVYVRDCASFGAPRCFRVSAHPEQQRLIAALSEVLSQLPS